MRLQRWSAGLKLMNVLISLGAVVLGLYLVVAVSAYVFQRRLIYYPDPIYTTPADEDLDGVEEIRLATPDGETLIVWHAPAEAGRPTILYFHGNAGDLASRAPRLQRFAAGGLGVFMPAYRGYSGSTGSPTEAALVADAQLAYEHLRKSGIPAGRIIVYGESLGTGVATQLAASREIGALVLDSPYTSIPDVGRWLYPFLPVETLTIDRFESKRYIGQVKAPILILHGTNDNTIPIELGRNLFQLAPEPKEMAELKGAGHSDIYSFGAWDKLRRFIDGVQSKQRTE
jgi:fermentation-respiration switch protein FrsA (DUF1100 family)